MTETILERRARPPKLLVTAGCTSLLAFVGGLAALGRGTR
jgi:hypothetical protein